METITFTFHNQKFHLKPYRGNYKVIRDDGWEVTTVGFNEYQGFLQSHRNGTWLREEEVVIGNEAIKAYWKVNTRKVEYWNKELCQ